MARGETTSAPKILRGVPIEAGCQGDLKSVVCGRRSRV